MTREYFRRTLNAPLAPAMDMPKPKPPGAEGAALATGLQSHTDTGKEKKVGACSGDYGDRKKQLNKEYQYLHGDNRVLKFLVVLQKTDQGSTMADQMLGLNVQYTLSYYLVDDTMDVKLIKTRRASRTDQTTLLKRGKIPKNWRDTANTQQESLGPEDIRVDGTLEFYGRILKILDCDETTREFYAEIGKPQPAKGNAGMGARNSATVADSGKDDGGGFLAIGQPNPTSQQLKSARVKREACQGQVLKVDVKLIKEPERRFQIFFFLEDDTLQVYEEVVKNSGMDGSPNYLKRGNYEVKVGESNTLQKANETLLELGTKFELNGFKWEVIRVDPSTTALCSGDPDRFPQFDPRTVFAKLLGVAMAEGIDIMSMFGRYDRDAGHCLPPELFKAAVSAEGIFASFTPQEVNTATAYVTGTDNKCYYPDMADMLSQLYFDADAEPKPTYEANSGTVMTAMLDAGKPWRRIFRALDRCVAATAVPLTDIQATMATNGVPVSDQDAFMLRYLYGVDPGTNSALTELLESREGGVAVAAACGSGTQAVKARSLREMNTLETSSGSPQVAAKELPVFLDVNKLCNDLYKPGWIY